MSAERLAEQSRLRWRCRRGMLELDLLLQGFLDNGYRRLSARQQQCFHGLLEQPDQRLFDWLVSGRKPDDPEVADVIEQIRRAPAP